MQHQQRQHSRSVSASAQYSSIYKIFQGIQPSMKASTMIDRYMTQNSLIDMRNNLNIKKTQSTIMMKSVSSQKFVRPQRYYDNIDSSSFRKRSVYVPRYIQAYQQHNQRRQRQRSENSHSHSQSQKNSKKHKQLSYLSSQRKLLHPLSPDVIVVLQTIEIQRLSTQIKSMRIKNSSYQRQINNFHNYQVQIQQLNQKLFDFEKQRSRYISQIQRLNSRCAGQNHQQQEKAELYQNQKDKIKSAKNPVQGRQVSQYKSKLLYEAKKNRQLFLDLQEWKDRYNRLQRSKQQEMEEMCKSMQNQQHYAMQALQLSKQNQLLNKETIPEFERQMKRLSNKAQKTQFQNNLLQRQIQQINTKWQKSEESILSETSALKIKTNQMGNKISDLNNLINKKAIQIKLVKQAFLKIRQNLSQHNLLSEQLKKSALEKKQIQANLELKQKQNIQLKARINFLQKQKQSENNQSNVSQNKQLKEKLQKYQKQIQKYKSYQVMSLQSQKNNDVQMKFNNRMQNKTDQLKQKIKKLQQELANATQQLKHTKKQSFVLKQQNQSKEKLKRQSMQQQLLAKLTNQKENMKNEIKLKNKQIQSLMEKFKQKQETIKSSIQLQTHLQQIKLQAQNLQSQHDIFVNKYFSKSISDTTDSSSSRFKASSSLNLQNQILFLKESIRKLSHTEKQNQQLHKIILQELANQNQQLVQQLHNSKIKISLLEQNLLQLKSKMFQSQKVQNNYAIQNIHHQLQSQINVSVSKQNLKQQQHMYKSLGIISKISFQQKNKNKLQQNSQNSQNSQDQKIYSVTDFKNIKFNKELGLGQKLLQQQKDQSVIKSQIVEYVNDDDDDDDDNDDEICKTTQSSRFFLYNSNVDYNNLDDDDEDSNSNDRGNSNSQNLNGDDSCYDNNQQQQGIKVNNSANISSSRQRLGVNLSQLQIDNEQYSKQSLAQHSQEQVSTPINKLKQINVFGVFCQSQQFIQQQHSQQSLGNYKIDSFHDNSNNINNSMNSLGEDNISCDQSKGKDKDKDESNKNVNVNEKILLCNKNAMMKKKHMKNITPTMTNQINHHLQNSYNKNNYTEHNINKNMSDQDNNDQDKCGKIEMLVLLNSKQIKQLNDNKVMMKMMMMKKKADDNVVINDKEKKEYLICSSSSSSSLLLQTDNNGVDNNNWVDQSTNNLMNKSTPLLKAQKL